jgi:hypothetical protein
MSTVKIDFYQGFWTALFNGEINFATDVFKAVLHNTAPDLAVDTEYGDLAGELSTAGGYTAGGFTVTITASLDGGLPKLVISDSTLTASGAVGPFQYLSIYDDTSTNDTLVGRIDYGSADSMASSDVLEIPSHTMFHLTAV